ncbi:MAG: nitroreductase family protein [Ignavibacteriota bacterium]|nr:nitroreductase family protein [Ignavibacteriota bacterium]
MKKIFIIPVTFFLALAFFASGINSFGKKPEPVSTNKIKLIAPEKTGGMPLMEALNKRHSSRNISSKKITDQELSNLLWAAFGINRDESGKRTAPTANDSRAMDVYVIMENGTYKYSAEDHSLDMVTEKDLRNFAGRQDFVYTAPVNLVYVADYSRLKEGSDKEIYSGAHAGFIGENVYLYCTSAGLGVVIRAWVDKEMLSKEMGLKENQKIILTQTVGYTE